MIFDKTRTPLTAWFDAAWHMITAKNGMSAKTLEQTMGISYHVAWHMLHRFRVAMVRASRELTTEQLANVVHKSGIEHRLHETTHYGDWNIKFPVLVIHQDISLSVKEMERLPNLRYMFLGDAPQLSEQLAAKKISYTDWKSGTATSPQDCTIVDQISDNANLIEAITLFTGEKPMPESILLALPDLRFWKCELNIRQGEDGKWDAHADDVLYSLYNSDTVRTIRIEAKPIDGRFSLQELKVGRDGLKDDRAFFMDRETGKIGEAAVRKNPETGKLEVRIKLAREESLILRIVRERVKHGEGLPRGIGFMEFESLPGWEYKE